jgi:hypothetical protein
MSPAMPSASPEMITIYENDGGTDFSMIFIRSYIKSKKSKVVPVLN